MKRRRYERSAEIDLNCDCLVWLWGQSTWRTILSHPIPSHSALDKLASQTQEVMEWSKRQSSSSAINISRMTSMNVMLSVQDNDDKREAKLQDGARSRSMIDQH